MKWFNNLLLRYKERHMSALGKAILEALRQDMWTYDNFTVMHKQSGLQLWVGASVNSFRIYDMPGAKYTEAEYTRMLTRIDDEVLRHYSVLIAQRQTQLPSQVVLNALRLSKHKENQS